MEDLTDEFGDAFTRLVKERFKPDIEWVNTGGNFRDDRHKQYEIKIKFLCTKCKESWTSKYGNIMIYYNI